jgi:hypothetical protein
MGGKSDEHQRKPARRREQCRKPFHRTPPSLFRATATRVRNRKARRVVLVPDLPLMVRMMRRCRGCLDTVKRGNSAWRGNTVAMMHYLRIVNSGGSQ